MVAAAPVGSGPPPPIRCPCYWGGSTWHCDWSMTDEPLTVTVTEPQAVTTGSAPAGPANAPRDDAATMAARAIRRIPCSLFSLGPTSRRVLVQNPNKPVNMVRERQPGALAYRLSQEYR